MKSHEGTFLCHVSFNMVIYNCPSLFLCLCDWLSETLFWIRVPTTKCKLQFVSLFARAILFHTQGGHVSTADVGRQCGEDHRLRRWPFSDLIVTETWTQEPLGSPGKAVANLLPSQPVSCQSTNCFRGANPLPLHPQQIANLLWLPIYSLIAGVFYLFTPSKLATYCSFRIVLVFHSDWAGKLKGRAGRV